MRGHHVLADRYELRDLIGAGGSARVYLAKDRVLDRVVAVKLLDRAVAESADPAAHERFLREGRSAAKFSHPNVVATYDAGTDGDSLYIVMEYVAGTSLAHVIANDAPLDDARVGVIGAQLLSALDAAHRAGIVHRDVKPANVLLTESGEVKLADFGIARRFDEITSSLTVEGMVVGTRGYLAPEQARGLELSPATDVYAVGAVLFELATGRRPEPGRTDSETGADPRTVRPDTDPGLAAVIAVATAGDPARRFTSAASMRDALTGDLPPMQPARQPGPSPSVAPTAIIGSAPTPETAVMSTDTVAYPSARRRDRRWMLATAAALGAAMIGVAAWAVVDQPDVVTSDSPSIAPVTTTATPNSGSSTPTTASTTPATTRATTPTNTPTTTPITTPTTPPEPPSPADLVPGFPYTDDIEQFIDQLRDGRDVAGKQARKLGDKMRDLLSEDDDRRDGVEKLRREIDKWVEDDELDQVVAEHALELISDIEQSDDDERDDD